MKEVLIIGGSGYVGSKLILNLLDKNYKVINYDLDIFGKGHLPFQNKNYYHVNGDVRDLSKLEKTLNKFKVKNIIHLACISNDPSFLLNKKLSKLINFQVFEPLVDLCKKTFVKKFIFASTCSVYGVSKLKNVTENSPLKPITEYNKYKALCEKILLKKIDSNFNAVIIRPATVCGVSPKMRFDVAVNILTNFAYFKKFIKVFGGDQSRPNIHIDDMVRLYVILLQKDLSKINGKIYNAGFENLTIKKIASKVKKNTEHKIKTQVEIKLEKTKDIRSYRINSNKIKKELNFFPKKNVDIAISDLIKFFVKKRPKDTFTNLNYYNVKKLKKINFK